MRVLRHAADARRYDEEAIEAFGIPQAVLMENAALAATEVAQRLWPRARRIAILCGKGNNGGDGMAMARHLRARLGGGAHLDLWLAAPRRELGAAAARQATTLEALGIGLREIRSATDETFLIGLAGADLVVDALLGTGLSRPLEGRLAAIVATVVACRRPVLALDLPSGLPTESVDEPPERCIEAAATVSFLAPKAVQVHGAGVAACGEVWIAPLGLPPPEKGAREDLRLTTRAAARGWLPLRRSDGHKGTFGHVLIVAGSAGKSGAVALAARAALRSGAGLVTCAVPESILAAVDVGCTEAMTLPLAIDDRGGLTPAALDAAVAAARDKDAVALGPGLGAESADWIRQFVSACDRPLVLDADGLNAFAGSPETLRARSAPTLLTPHPGEAGRLLGEPPGPGLESRIEAVEALSARTGGAVLLKGAGTLVGDDGAVTLNLSGNAGMATAGSGDVLTGVAAAYLAQGCDPGRALRLAAFVHGAAGDLAASLVGESALVAGDLIAALGPAQRRLAAVPDAVGAVFPLRQQTSLFASDPGDGNGGIA